MAEFIGSKQRQMRQTDKKAEHGFNAFGKPVPYYRRDAAMEHCRAMGLTNTQHAMNTIDRMSEAIARDEPYQAMEAGMVYLDLIGTYRLLAVLLNSRKRINRAR